MDREWSDLDIVFSIGVTFALGALITIFFFGSSEEASGGETDKDFGLALIDLLNQHDPHWCPVEVIALLKNVVNEDLVREYDAVVCAGLIVQNIATKESEYSDIDPMFLSKPLRAKMAHFLRYASGMAGAVYKDSRCCIHVDYLTETMVVCFTNELLNQLRFTAAEIQDQNVVPFSFLPHFECSEHFNVAMSSYYDTYNPIIENLLKENSENSSLLLKVVFTGHGMGGTVSSTFAYILYESELSHRFECEAFVYGPIPCLVSRTHIDAKYIHVLVQEADVYSRLSTAKVQNLEKFIETLGKHSSAGNRLDWVLKDQAPNSVVADCLNTTLGIVNTFTPSIKDRKHIGDIYHIEGGHLYMQASRFYSLPLVGRSSFVLDHELNKYSCALNKLA